MADTFDPFSSGLASEAKPVSAQPQATNTQVVAEKSFDPFAEGVAKDNRLPKLKELSETLSNPKATDEAKQQAENEYIDTYDKYATETSTWQRVKDKLGDIDFKKAGAGLWEQAKNVASVNPVSASINSYTEAKAKLGPDADVTDIAKETAKNYYKKAGAALVGVQAAGSDVMHGTAGLLAGAGSEVANAVGAHKYAGALQAEKMKQAAFLEGGHEKALETLGVEDQQKEFQGARTAAGLAEGAAIPVGIPGAGKLIGKATEAAGDAVATTGAKLAGYAGKAGIKGAEISADSTVGLPVSAGSAKSFLGLGKYTKAIKDAILDVGEQKVGAALDKTLDDTYTPLFTNAAGASKSLADLGKTVVSSGREWANFPIKVRDGIQSILTNAAEGTSDLLTKSKLGEDIVTTAQRAGAEIIAEQKALAAELTNAIANPDATLTPFKQAYQKSVSLSKLHETEAKIAQTMAGMQVMQKLGGAAKLTRKASDALASATMGGLVGSGLGAAGRAPGEQGNAAADFLTGAGYGLILSNLGKAALDRVPDNAEVTPDSPLPKEVLDLVLVDDGYSKAVQYNAKDLLVGARDAAKKANKELPAPEAQKQIGNGQEVQQLPAPEAQKQLPAPKDEVPVKQEQSVAEPTTEQPAMSNRPVGVKTVPSSTDKLGRPGLQPELGLGDVKAKAPDHVILAKKIDIIEAKKAKLEDEFAALPHGDPKEQSLNAQLDKLESDLAEHYKKLKAIDKKRLEEEMSVSTQPKIYTT